MYYIYYVQKEIRDLKCVCECVCVFLCVGKNLPQDKEDTCECLFLPDPIHGCHGHDHKEDMHRVAGHGGSGSP